MRTDYLIKKLEFILYSLIKDAEFKPIIELKYCDMLTAKSNLDLIVKVNLYMTTEGYDENEVSIIEFESCQVDKFDVLDENSDPLCSGDQIKDLVMHTNEYVSNYYIKL